MSYQREQISSLLIHANYKLVSTLQNMWKLFNFESSPRHFENQHNKTTLTWFIARLNVMKPMIIDTKNVLGLILFFKSWWLCELESFFLRCITNKMQMKKKQISFCILVFCNVCEWRGVEIRVLSIKTTTSFVGEMDVILSTCRRH